MPILKDHAQVLRVYEQGNTSQVVVFLGRRLGQFRVHAKGSRRWPKKGFELGFDLLARGEILVYPRRGETLWLLKEWDEHARPKLGTSLNRLRVASFLCELSEALTRPRAGAGVDLDRTPVARSDETAGDSAVLYDLLANAADKIAGGAVPGPVVMQFALKALLEEGYLPDVKECAGCGRRLDRIKPADWPVWLSASGLVCVPCRQKALQMANAPATQGKQGRAKATRTALPIERGTPLSPDAWRAMLHIGRNGTPVKVRPGAAEQLGRALIILVHGALEHDLRTLVSAARSVRAIAAR